MRNVNYRQGQEKDCQEIAELSYMASDGAVEYLFRDLVPNMTATEVLSNGLKRDVYPHTFRSTIVAECEDKILGMAMSYPAEFHRITSVLREFLPESRLERFTDFYSSKVEGSYFLDAIGVYPENRGSGIGKHLLDETKKKAVVEGYAELSLIVFADNQAAIRFYKNNDFHHVKSIELMRHELMPHDGGCCLLNCKI